MGACLTLLCTWLVLGATAGRQRAVASLARLAIVRAYQGQSAQCSPRSAASPQVPLPIPEGAALALSGVRPAATGTCCEYRYFADDLCLDEGWAIGLRSTVADYAPAANWTPQHNKYVRFWSASTASLRTRLGPGFYRLEVLGLHCKPGPVKVRVTANEFPLGVLWFCGDDNGWGVESLVISPAYWLAEGRVAESLDLAFAFANDGGDELGTRDAGIVQVTLVPVRCCREGSDGVAQGLPWCSQPWRSVCQ